jgi:hypothetical protein
MTDNTSEYAEIMTAKAWRPNPGEAIEGTVANLRRQDDEYGGHVVVTLAVATEGEAPAYTAVHAFHHVLKTQLSALKPAKGAPLKITYLGKVDGKNQPYHSYLVQDPTAAAEEFTWDAEPEAAF